MRSAHVHFSKKLFQINANWTAVESIHGWKHYRIAARRLNDEGTWELEMMAVCDRDVRFWVSRSTLRQAEMWAPGWL